MGEPIGDASVAGIEPGPSARTLPSGATLAGWLGILGVACTTASAPLMPIWGFPGSGASGQTIAHFVVGHHDRLVAGMMLNIVGVTLWAVLGAGVWQRLRTVAGSVDLLVTCFGVGLVIFVTLILTGFLVFGVLAFQLPEPATARLLYDLTFGLLAISGAPTALCLLAYAVVTLRVKCFPVATAWIAMVAAAAHVLLVFSLVIPRGFFSLQGQVITAVPATLFAWLLAVAIALVRGQEQTRHRSPADTEAALPSGPAL